MLERSTKHPFIFGFEFGKQQQCSVAVPYHFIPWASKGCCSSHKKKKHMRKWVNPSGSSTKDPSYKRSPERQCQSLLSLDTGKRIQSPTYFSTHQIPSIHCQDHALSNLHSTTTNITFPSPTHHNTIVWHLHR